ncbi:MAG: nucleotidyltransferase domain-containing protein [Bacteroidota bacterium]
MKIEQLDELKKDVEEAVKKLLGDKLRSIVLYGSYARGDYDLESDIDFAAITNIKNEDLNAFTNEIGEIITDLTLKYGILVTLILLNEETFNRYGTILPFYNNIVKEGIALYGSKS